MENTKIIIACLPKVSCMAGNEKDELNSMLDSAPYRSTSITIKVGAFSVKIIWILSFPSQAYFLFTGKVPILLTFL